MLRSERLHFYPPNETVAVCYGHPPRYPRHIRQQFSMGASPKGYVLRAVCPACGMLHVSFITTTHDTPDVNLPPAYKS